MFHQPEKTHRVCYLSLSNHDTVPVNFSLIIILYLVNLHRLDHELVELLWQNGQVVMHSQANRKLPGNSSNLRQMQKTTLRTSEPNLDQEEAAPWIQYPLDDPLEQGLCSNLLSELPPPCEVESYYKPIRELEEEKFANIFSPSPSQENLMSAPGLHVPDSSQKINDFGASRKVLNFPHFSAPRNVSSPSQKTAVNLSQSVAREHSVITVGSSHCSSNHIPQDQGVNRVSSSGVWATTTNNTTLSAEPDAVDCIQRPAPRNERGKSEMIEPTVTSSSGGCGNTGIGRTCSLSTREHGRKRKGTEEEALEEQSEVIYSSSSSFSFHIFLHNACLLSSLIFFFPFDSVFDYDPHTHAYQKQLLLGCFYYVLT